MKTPMFVSTIVIAVAAVALGACAAPADAPDARSGESVASTKQAMVPLENCRDLGGYRYECNASAPFEIRNKPTDYYLLDNVSAWTDESVDIYNEGTEPVLLFVEQLFGRSTPTLVAPGGMINAHAIDKGGPLFAVIMRLPEAADPKGVALYIEKH